MSRFILLIVLFPSACGDARPGSDDSPPSGTGTVLPVPDAALPWPGVTDSVTVYFTRDERPVGTARVVSDGAGPEAALRALLRGPTPSEEREGFTSWFSEDTAGTLRAFTLGPEGDAVVDFHDLRAIIPNASTSFGSEMLLGELNRTLFQFPEVRTVEYRIEGSCEMFWSWLQYSCEVIPSPGT